MNLWTCPIPIHHPSHKFPCFANRVDTFHTSSNFSERSAQLSDNNRTEYNSLRQTWEAKNTEADPKIARDITLMHLMRFVDLFNLLSKAHIQTGVCYCLYIIFTSLSSNNTAKRPTGLIP